MLKWPTDLIICGFYYAKYVKYVWYDLHLHFTLLLNIVNEDTINNEGEEHKAFRQDKTAARADKFPVAWAGARVEERVLQPGGGVPQVHGWNWLVKIKTTRFIVLKADVNDNSRSNLSYHLQYGDKILLSSVAAKKYLHATDDFPS